MTSTQHLVFLAVVLARLVVPLFIPRYPLPAIVAALIIDGVDQTIFQAFHVTQVLGVYQSYDKALDIYYLVIAYTATMRNWDDPFAFRIAQFLWYYRLVGVLAFELSGQNWLLFVFPNTFEYFFIAYEAVRVFWDPRRLSHRQLLWGAAFIWVVIKLPQEWWIHIAKLDATDEIAAHPVLATVLFALLAVVLTVFVVEVRRRAPAPDWRPRVRVDAPPSENVPEDRRDWLLATGEKAVLISMILVIFANIVPTSLRSIDLAIVVVVVVVLNGVVTELLASTGRLPLSLIKRFAAIVVVNAVIFELLYWLGRDRHVNVAAALFVLLLLSLIITLFDEYRGVRHRKLAAVG
ncbi:hypothetical protein SAMN05892883_0358 [Jatrophihabitans sp. GAS493]|uniref:hypothetical protein n=1 Tax=Jatrophihabitans sp. GAS493 TaxID=1907575 RepID=UPI000BB80F78|nr:hypothetical protein [Jatrophihabitans sp. GAS493]SOD70699.1 hypothetical protein SAMN05892883_0358 [Jatrophihabitans sp. GAS493]